ncbi:PadR family transcriptional regulator [Actinoallomurus sp. NPDC050550]|uniref:PadR family transcriptional regulator n=1 Tax=Actinoallomurus sp. NPDC050550 TaxID=3154937 RepID=UPI003411E483
MTTPKGSPLALTILGILHTRPLHPYGIQRLIKQWGKDQVVNVGQRATLYRTIDRLQAAGLVAVRETERDSQYPERTVYEITEAGRRATREWLEEMLTVPRKEFSDFPVALSHVLMLEPAEALQLLERREAQLSAAFQGLEANAGAAEFLPRVVTLESEYVLKTAQAQLDWIRSVIADLRSGRLTWSMEELAAIASGQTEQYEE